MTSMKMKLLILLAAALVSFSCKDKKKTIHIATKPITEQFILGEMLQQLIEENTDYDVELTKGISGGTSTLHPALLKGDFDLYPEYTGTGWLVVLKKDSFPGPDELYRRVKDEYANQFNVVWLSPYGFNNSYSLAVTKENAGKYQLKKFSDLAKHPGVFVLGAEYDFFEIPMGYKELCDCYGLQFKDTKDMDIGLKYGAIKSGKVDVTNVFTTDGQLSGSGLVVLEDDKHFFPSYQCATIVREDALERFPELEGVLQKMAGILTDGEMSELNAQVDIEGRPDKVVAHEFLEKKGLLP